MLEGAVADDFCFSSTKSAAGRKKRNDAMVAREIVVSSVFEASINIERV